MRIVFDCRYTRTDRHDGISRYTAGLVTALGRLHPVTMLISDHRQLRLLPDLPWALVSSPTSIREPLVALQVNSLKPDVVFSPMQTMGSWGRHYRLILTVHDLIYYRHRTPPPAFSLLIRLLWRLYHLSWWPQRWLLNRADAVVVVSETTGELLQEHDLTRRPITVVHNAAEAPSTQKKPVPADGRSRDLVYMGSFMPYKNVEALVDAMRYLPEYQLHLMSRITDRERSDLTTRAGTSAKQLVIHNGVTDAEYLDVLGKATALVSASKEEGFGIPLVESMSVGTPVVVSDIPIFREIGGEAAVFFDPDDPKQIASAISALGSREEWSRRSDAARIQAARFTWHNSAERLLELMRSLNRQTDPQMDPLVN